MLTSSCAELHRRLRQQLRECAYPGYVYGYPHKKAYRPLLRPLPLNTVWDEEDRRNLFAYVHIPFCGQRCSFCNLFTFIPTGDDPATDYLDALAREADAYAQALRRFHFCRLYIGGGTPTYLSAAQFRRLLRLLRNSLGIDPAVTHGCVEVSPETIDAEKTTMLREAGFQRLSLGVQSLVEYELREVNRRFDFGLHRRAIELIGSAGFPHFNIDLIYGLPGQTNESWRYSLQCAIDTPATSLFLYPLYTRPRTGLANRRRGSLEAFTAPTTQQMAGMYDWAIERLHQAGFRQWTMRQFRRDVLPPVSREGEASAEPGKASSAGASHSSHLAFQSDDEYRCQHDGMVGLGAGARSYTTGLHYSTPWRMVARNIRGVIDQYQQRTMAGDTAVSHGFTLNEDEKRRRYVILSLLFDGLDTNAFAHIFDADARHLFAAVWEALDIEGCIRDDGALIRLTPRGVRHADIVGQLFFSPTVEQLIETYEYDP
jgi:oxygen-independent coproporphyrinogen-3 oxidase